MIKPNRNIETPRLIDHIIDRSRDRDGDGIDDEDERLLTAYEKPEYFREKFFSRAVDWTEKAIVGSNTAGKIAGVVLDGLSLVAPAGGTINKFRNGVKSLIQTNEVPVMDKPKLLSKTVWGAILIVITAILEAVGVSFVTNPETMQIIYSVMYSVAGALGLYGLRDAVGKLINQKQ